MRSFGCRPTTVCPTGCWPSVQYYVGLLSCGVGLKSNQKAVAYPIYDIDIVLYLPRGQSFIGFMAG